jgi:hypothetical protein
MKMNPTHIATFALMALGIVSGAVVANVPEAFPYLWALKAATVSFTGVAGLLMNPTPAPK